MPGSPRLRRSLRLRPKDRRPPQVTSYKDLESLCLYFGISRYHRNREVTGQPFVSKVLRSCVKLCDARMVAFSAEIAIP